MAAFKNTMFRYQLPFLGDLLLVPVAVLVAYQLRFGLQPMPAGFLRSALTVSPLVMLTTALCWWAVGLHRGQGMPYWRLLTAAFAGVIAGSALIVPLHGLDGVPRSSLLILGPLLWLCWLARRRLAPLLLPHITSLAGVLLPFFSRGRRCLLKVGALVAGYWRHALDLLQFAAFCGVLYWAFQDRALWIDATFGGALGCKGCLTRSLLLHDYLFFGGLLLLFLFSFMARRYLLYLPLRLLALVGVLLYIGDIVLMDQFFTRLMLSDLGIYGDQLPLVWRHIVTTNMFAGHSWLLPLAISVGLLLLFVPPVGKASRKALVVLGILPLVALSSGSAIAPPSYVHDWALRNVLAANFNTGVTKRYSRAYRQQLLSDAGQVAQTCRPGAGQAPDIVLLILESWSPFHSGLWSGIEHWTPRLDGLARQHAWFSRLHAGGYSTNEGLISILTGLEYIAPLKPFFSVRPYETAWETPGTIPRQLSANQDYHTAFLTSGNLGFSNKGKWLRSLGFAFVEGHDYPGYEGRKRLHFDSAADEFLYARALDYLRERPLAQAPLFLAVENVSSHHPYIHPETGERSAEAVFRYMDRTAYAFYQQLRDTGFFDNGLMLIVGDHRAMVPLRSEETELFGQAAASLVPAILIGSELNGEISTPFHQSDILPSLDALTTREQCTAGPYRNLLQPEQTEARCLYHARGDNRDHIDAFCPLPDGSEARAVVKLRGDSTAILESSGMPADLERQVILEINTHRVLGDERSRRLVEAGYFN